MTGVLDAQPKVAGWQKRTDHRIRTAVAILVSRFPRIDETYILREIIELERQGQPVVLVPMLRGKGKVLHDEARPWLRRALYMPLFSLSILRSNLRAMFTRPGRYFGILGRIIAATFYRPRTLIRSLAVFPKSVHLAHVLPKQGVHHVHAHFATHATTMAYIISALSNLTYSFTVHGPDIFVHRVMLHEKVRRAKFVRAISTFNKAFLGGLYPEASGSKIEVVHMGLLPEVYAEAAREARQESRLRILSASSLLPNKGYPFLIEACARLLEEGIDLECTIVGDGPLREATEKWIEKHGLKDRVKLTGALPQNEVARLMGECDLFVLPSIIAQDGQMDGIPMTLMEAMAAGRPVVAASISGIPELVTSGVSGILVDATHTERIAQSIRRLTDPALRERMGRAGQKKVREEFDVRRTAADIIELFDRHEENVQEDASAAVGAMRWPDLRRASVGVRRVHNRRDSLVAEVTVGDGASAREMVIKQHKSRPGESRPPLVRARHELGILRTLRAVLEAEPAGDVTFAVPSVASFDEEHCALMITRAEGTPLDRMLRKARNRGAMGRLTMPLRRTGQWLRLMQNKTEVDEDGRHLLTAAMFFALQDLDLAAAADRELRRHHDEIGTKLRELEARVSDRPLPVVGHHGDYWPGNIFIGERHVEVIDFEGFREGLPFEDVAYFLVMLELPFAYPFFHRHFAKLSQSFLDGYLGADAPLDRDALRLFTAMKALQILARGGAAARTSWKTWWMRHELIRIIFRSIA